jgi:hypothetical protein
MFVKREQYTLEIKQMRMLQLIYQNFLFEVGDDLCVLSSTSQRGREVNKLDSERWILASLNEKFGYVPENFTS